MVTPNPIAPVQLKAHEIYLNQMVEVKWRLRATSRILGAKKPLTLNADVDNESAVLQVRKIIELITFSAIVADEQRYWRLRELDAETNLRDRGDYSLDWNAPDILQRLAKISPYFLPRPLGPAVRAGEGLVHFSEAKAKLTHDRLIAIYKTAGGYLHSPNPYKPNVSEIESKKKAETRTLLLKEVPWLESVIWEHAKIGLAWNSEDDPLTLDQPNQAWIVSFGAKHTNEVGMSLAIAV